MSTFLDFPNEVISMGLSVLDVHNKWKSILTNAGWQIKAEQTAAKPYTLDVFPPASEAIGNADAYEFLRISTNDTLVSWQPLKHWNRAFPQMVAFSGTTAGAVLLTATLAGVPITYQGIAGNTAEDNMVGLFNAIKASANATWMAYSWEISFPAPQNANDTLVWIVGTKNTYAAAVDTVSGTNCGALQLGRPVAPGYDQPPTQGPSQASVTIDLTNGFIYYFQISSRGIALVIRTNSAYFGALHACYADHDKALAAVPKNSPFCTPIELIVGVDDDSTNCDSGGRIAAPWIMPSAFSCRNDGDNYPWGGPGSGRGFRDVFQDGITTTYGFQSYSPGDKYQLFGSYLFADDDSIGNDFQVHRIGRSGYFTYSAGNIGVFFLLPPFIMADWYKFRGTAVDENLITVADTVKIANLVTDAALDSATIQVDDLSVFQPAGSIVIGKEWIEYTGKSASSGGGNLTGCKRGTWSTAARKHYAGERVCQGLWFVKVNGSCVFAGFTKPTA
jgi:hypothetical protein